jgi:hypothetical protein
MRQIIDGKLYDTDKAQLVAHDRYWDGQNLDRNGRNIFLYKTKKGNFFLYCTSRWQGERSYIEPLSKALAKYWYERLPEHELEYDEVFDDIPEEA